MQGLALTRDGAHDCPRQGRIGKLLPFARHSYAAWRLGVRRLARQPLT